MCDKEREPRDGAGAIPDIDADLERLIEACGFDPALSACPLAGTVECDELCPFSGTPTWEG